MAAIPIKLIHFLSEKNGSCCIQYWTIRPFFNIHVHVSGEMSIRLLTIYGLKLSVKYESYLSIAQPSKIGLVVGDLCKSER